MNVRSCGMMNRPRAAPSAQRLRHLVAPAATPAARQHPGTTAPWRQWLSSVDRDYPQPVALQPISGEVPRDLHGTFFNNGPGKFESQGEPVRHLFDPQALLKAIRFADGQVTYQSRLLQTRGQRLEDGLGRRLYGGAGWLPVGGLLGMLVGLAGKNTANTHIIAYAGRLLALNEGGLPYRIDPQTLETCGEETFGGLLRRGDTFGAHPKLHPDTGDLYNFGVTVKGNSSVQIYRIAPSGAGHKLASFVLGGMRSVHDFLLTKSRAVFLEPPLRIEAADMLAGKLTPRDGVSFDDAAPSELLTVDLASGAVARHRLPTLLSFHGINAWDQPDGSLRVDLCTYPDGSLLPTLHDIMRGDWRTTVAGEVTRVHVGPRGVETSAVTHPQHGSCGLDFPRLPVGSLGRPADRVRGITWGPDGPLPYLPVDLTLSDGTMAHLPLAEGEFSGEHVPASGICVAGKSKHYWLALVACTAQGRSEVRVYDEGPLRSASELCRLPLPHFLPFGFHGNWLPAVDGGQCVD